MQIEVPQAIYAMLPAAVTQLVVVLKDTALGSIIMYTDLLQESRRLGSMYFNILQTLVVAAVVYFIACWLLSRLAEWLPESQIKFDKNGKPLRENPFGDLLKEAKPKEAKPKGDK